MESTTASFAIRQLGRADATLYRDIRLEGLRLYPDSFSADFDAEAAEPLAWFADRLANSVVLGAFAGTTLVGVAGFFRRPGAKRAHKAVVGGVYVRSASRRKGIARALMERVIDEARSCVETLLLSVEKDNAPARQLYQSLGFVEYGTEKSAVKIDGRYYDEVLTAKPLR